MDNGPKPTHLWHLTGKKHFASILKDKLTALPRPLSPRLAVPDTVQLLGLLLASVGAICYSYGWMSPPRDQDAIKVRTMNPCCGPPPAKRKCSSADVPGPCPTCKKPPKPKTCPPE